MQREKVQFTSGGTECAAWHYPGSSGACVVMAGGGGVTKEPGTDRFAARFQAAGFSVLAFDYRYQGESGGTPRQIIRPREQLADWGAALSFAATLPGLDPSRIAIWGFSLSGGHVVQVAAEHAAGNAGITVAAVIAQSPFTDGRAAAPNALRHETIGVILRFPFLAMWDAVGGLFGRAPLVVPLAGPRGTVAMLTTPDAQDADRALNPGNAYPQWQQTIAARSVLRLGGYRPGRGAPGVECPLLVVVCERDESVLAAPALRMASRAPRAEVVQLAGSHYAPFLGEHERAVEAELDFLRRQLGSS